MNTLKTLALIVLISCTVTLYSQTYSAQIQQTISITENDAYENGDANGLMNMDTYGFTLVETWMPHQIGLRFVDLTIPVGATITEAYIQFTCRKPEDSMEPADLNIQGHLTADAPIFEDVAKNISTRTKTVEVVDWSPEVWRWKDFAGTDEKTPNIASVFQEIVAQGSWQPGNAIAIIFTGTGARSANNFDSGIPASLFLKYEAPNPTAPIANIRINEIAPNGTEYLDDTGDFEDWIELYNENNFPVNIGGLFLSDKKDDLGKWQIGSPEEIPANSFTTIWADNNPQKGGLHADFALNKNEETLILSQFLNNQYTVIDSFTYSPVPFKGSIGRENEQSENWVLFGKPTPKASNSTGLGSIEKPLIELASGVYVGEQFVTISHPDPTVTIRYTVDDKEPSEFAILYTGPISITSNTTINARAFKDGLAESNIATKSYLFTPANDLPVVMISTDPDNLFSPETGIYVSGDGGEDVFICGGFQNQNYNQDWERPARFTLFENSGDLAFEVNAGIKIAGSCSRKYALKTLNVYLRNNQYGHKDINYQLFPDRDFSKYKRLKLRNSGQDYRGCHMRDGVNQALIGQGLGMEYQAYRPTVVYINGEYWGIANFRELYGDEYFNDFHDVKKEDLDLIKSAEFSRQIKEGDAIHFQELYDYVLDNGLLNQSDFDFFTSKVDVDNFINYWISMLYISNNDWPANNKQIWRPRTDDGKWRWMLIDTDGSTNLSGADSDQGHRSDKLSKVLQDTITTWPNDSRSTLFFRSAMKFNAFENEFLQKSCTHMELALNSTRVLPMIDQYQGALDADIEAHLQRWAFDNPNLTEKDIWLDNAGKFRNFYEARRPFFYGNLIDNLAAVDTFDLSFNYDATTNGDVVIHWDEMEIPFNYSGTYFKNIPLRVKAIPHDNYIFVKWEETGNTNAEIEYMASENSSLTPIFEFMSSTNESLAQQQLKLWPNPTANTFTVDFSPTEQGTLQLIEMSTGKMIHQYPVNSKQLNIDIHRYPAGIYLVQYTNKEGLKKVSKLVKL